ncbi:MAG: S41 family peptidase [Planctomycetota bacterium]
MRRLTILTLAVGGLALTTCAGLEPLTDLQAKRLEQIDELLEVLEEDYVFPKRHDLDWDSLRKQYRAAAPFSARPNDFYHLLTGMLSELDDLHVSFDVPPENLVEDGRAATTVLEVPGFYLMPIEGRPYIVGWPEGQQPRRPERLPEAAAFPEVVRIEGFRAIWPLVPNLLRGRPGSAAELHLRWRDGSVTRHTVARPEEVEEPGGSGVVSAWQLGGGTSLQWEELGGYLYLDLRTLDRDRIELEEIDAILDRARESKGLILDLRRNPGGDWALTGAIGGRFLREPLTFALSAKPEESFFFGLISVDPFISSSWEPRGDRYEGPLIVLTSALTGSGAEHLALVLQREVGAIVIGERTSGAEAGVARYVAQDGSTLRFSAIRLLDLRGRGLQDSGVVPDVSVRLTLADVERLGPSGAFRNWEERIFAAVGRELGGVSLLERPVPRAESRQEVTR